MRGIGRGGERMPRIGFDRTILCTEAQDRHECSTAHRPHTDATDAPSARHRARASSTTIGVNAATPTHPSGSRVRNRATDACEERVADRIGARRR